MRGLWLFPSYVCPADYIVCVSNAWPWRGIPYHYGGMGIKEAIASVIFANITSRQEYRKEVTSQTRKNLNLKKLWSAIVACLFSFKRSFETFVGS